MVKRIIGIVFMLVIIGWVGIIMYDALNSTNGNPKFCISKEVKEYPDGTVEKCTGLGYVVYVYDRANYKEIKFGPFWEKEKSEEQFNNQ